MFGTPHEGSRRIFLTVNPHVIMRPGLPLVKCLFKSTVCYSRDFTVPAKMKDYLLLTQHYTAPILPSVACTEVN